jgi:transcription-repair coupling factor (superfamily II helicase)
LSEVAQKRLTAIRDFTALGSGFRIALKDLEVRGAGNLLGGEQSGHMEAIGYDMYTRMLDEAIKELSGRQLPKKKTALVDLDTDAYLGRDYIRDDGVRLDLYRKIAAIETLADYRDVIDELVDRFGDIPRPAQSLIDVAYIRSFAERRGLSTIRNEGDDILFYLADSEVDLKSFSVWMDEKKYRGRLHFNAGHRPHLLFRKAAADKRKTVSRIRELFLLADEAEAATKN